MMATFDVLQRAAAANRNLIITHEPTFYGHQDQTTELENEKGSRRTPPSRISSRSTISWSGAFTILAPAAAGWNPYGYSEGTGVGVEPASRRSVGVHDERDDAADSRRRHRTKLDAKTLRVVGDPQLKVTAVALSPGFAGYPNNRRLLQMPDVQVVVIGEAHEWEAIEHAADAPPAGLQ